MATDSTTGAFVSKAATLPALTSLYGTSPFRMWAGNAPESDGATADAGSLPDAIVTEGESTWERVTGAAFIEKATITVESYAVTKESADAQAETVRTSMTNATLTFASAGHTWMATFPLGRVAAIEGVRAGRGASIGTPVWRATNTFRVMIQRPKN